MAEPHDIFVYLPSISHSSPSTLSVTVSPSVSDLLKVCRHSSPSAGPGLIRDLAGSWGTHSRPHRVCVLTWFEHIPLCHLPNPGWLTSSRGTIKTDLNGGRTSRPRQKKEVPRRTECCNKSRKSRLGKKKTKKKTNVWFSCSPSCVT